MDKTIGLPMGIVRIADVEPPVVAIDRLDDVQPLRTVLVRITVENAIDLMIEHLTEAHLDRIGGYQYDYEWIGDTLVVAALDPGKAYYRTMIETYQREDLLDWFERAIAFCVEEDQDDFQMALYETAS